VLVLGDLGIAVLGELVELTFDHLQRDVAQHAQDVDAVVLEGHAERLDVQVVAEQDGDVVAPSGMHREAAPSEFRVVDDVVVNECRGVDELDDRRVEDGHVAVRLAAGQSAGHQHHRRPHPLAARVLQVLADLRDQLDARVDVPQECLVDAFKVFPDGLEQLR